MLLCVFVCDCCCLLLFAVRVCVGVLLVVCCVLLVLCFVMYVF